MIHSRLGAFRLVSGEPTGLKLAETFIAVLQDLCVLHKVEFAYTNAGFSVDLCLPDWLHYYGQDLEMLCNDARR